MDFDNECNYLICMKKVHVYFYQEVYIVQYRKRTRWNQNDIRRRFTFMHHRLTHMIYHLKARREREREIKKNAWHTCKYLYSALFHIENAYSYQDQILRTTFFIMFCQVPEEKMSYKERDNKSLPSSRVFNSNMW